MAIQNGIDASQWPVASATSASMMHHQHHHHHHHHVTASEAVGIREVWAHNLEREFDTIRKLAITYKYIAMDTEFPGVVARPIGEFRSTQDYEYQLRRCNVDHLKMIQLGISFFDENGKTPHPITTWQFNFRFNLTEDMYAEDSIKLLAKSGIQFDKHECEGIDPLLFAELIMTSGIVLMDDVIWISFHSGYDFGYLLKVLTNQNLPQEESEFFELLRAFFPNMYDVKYLMKSCKNLKGGLQELADQLELTRVGPQHQAGSDSLLTGAAFFKMRELFFEDNIDDNKYGGHLYGLGTSFFMNGAGAASTSAASTAGAAAAAAVATPPAAAASSVTPSSSSAATAAAVVQENGETGQSTSSSQPVAVSTV